ncbi:MAG: CoA transferase [Proteobacteria bacterium]|nr:CoA transferase [Pseudomonadota bacterium]
MDPLDVLSDIWRDAGCPADALDSLRLTGAEPVLPSSFRVGTAAQATIAAATLAAAEFWRLQTGSRQRVTVDMRHAAAEFRSERYLRVDDGPPPPLWDKIAGVYRAGDGRWLRIHTNFPRHREGLLALLGCDYDRDAVSGALSGWEAEALETAAAEAGLLVAMMRSPAEWDAHAQAPAVAAGPLLSIERIGDAPPEQPAPGERPLSGVRVLDLTRVIAGPVCGRALAAHGADVMRVTAPHLPSMAPLVIDAGRGKLSAHIDLREAAGRRTLKELLGQADVFVQGYRPGAIAKLGFSPEACAAARPGIVYVSLSAYGGTGPWAAKRGFDSLVQTATGFNHMEAEATGAEDPKPLPCQALDHASGYLMAFGAIVALMRRARDGGSWSVGVSLARTGQWLKGLGRIEDGFDCAETAVEDVADLMEESSSGFGRLLTVKHAGLLSETPPTWARPSMPLGSHPPRWET